MIGGLLDMVDRLKDRAQLVGELMDKAIEHIAPKAIAKAGCAGSSRTCGYQCSIYNCWVSPNCVNGYKDKYLTVIQYYAPCGNCSSCKQSCEDCNSLCYGLLAC